MSENQKQQLKELTKEDEDSGDLLMGRIHLLPEECISTILSFTSPQHAIKSSLVSSIFKSAAESDLVWENFIPSIYPEIISRSWSTSVIKNTSLLEDFSSKKDFYCSICNKPILIDGGSKSFEIEKGSGKIYFMVGARDLTIVQGSIPWSWEPS